MYSMCDMTAKMSCGLSVRFDMHTVIPVVLNPTPGIHLT